MSPYPDIDKMEKRIAALMEADWHREQQLRSMGAVCAYLEYARQHRPFGQRGLVARYLSKANERYQEAVRHYAIAKKLEGKNVHP